jgi:phosphate/sulfate permease
MQSSATFIWAMMAALLSAALWVNLATWIGAPVSTTHSVVGGVMGAGVAAAGFSAGKLGHNGKDCSELVHLTNFRRNNCCSISLVHKGKHHLPE